jgi:hypothetical protein
MVPKELVVVAVINLSVGDIFFMSEEVWRL